MGYVFEKFDDFNDPVEANNWDGGWGTGGADLYSGSDNSRLGPSGANSIKLDGDFSTRFDETGGQRNPSVFEFYIGAGSGQRLYWHFGLSKADSGGNYHSSNKDNVCTLYFNNGNDEIEIRGSSTKTLTGWDSSTLDTRCRLSFDWVNDEVTLRVDDPNGHLGTKTVSQKQTPGRLSQMTLGWTETWGSVYIDDLTFETVQEPSTPQNLTASAVSGGQIDLNWDSVSWNGDQGHYDIYRDGSYITNVSAGTTSYTDTGLNDGQTYSYRVRAQNSGGASSKSNSDSATTNLPNPSSVSATMQANDQIDVSWSDNANSTDNFRVKMQRDGGSWVSPSGGNATPSSTSASYGPNSDYSYASQVGIDSSFRFRVRAETQDVNSGWAYSSTVYTSPIPPHNPSVSRPDANTFRITYTNKTDIPDGQGIKVREDTGAGYGSWQLLTYVNPADAWIVSGDPSTEGDTVTVELNTGSNNYNGSIELKEDARYQFRLVNFNNPANQVFSNEVYADYGNSGNVYFSDDFEDQDFAEWTATSGATINSGSGDSNVPTGVSGADQGTYYAAFDAGGYLRKSLGDLSSESDVIVKAAVAVGSQDSSGEFLDIRWYDGSSWHDLRTIGHEYNRQGWVEVTALVPSSYLSTDNRVQFGGDSGGGGDQHAVDRVVVSDILHEYTQPAAPTNLELDNTVKGEITLTWSQNADLINESGGNYQIERDKAGQTSPTEVYEGGNESFNSYTDTGLNDGEKYDYNLGPYYRQYRHGSTNNYWHSSHISGTTITRFPANTSLSASNITTTSADLSWTNGSSDADAQRVYVRETGQAAGMDFVRSNQEYIRINHDLSNLYNDTLSLTARGVIDAYPPTGEVATLMTQSFNGDNVTFAIRLLDSGDIEIGIFDGSWHYSGTWAAPTGQEITVTGRYDGSTLSLIGDGSERASSSFNGGLPNDPSPWDIGRRWDNKGVNGSYHDGRIFDIQMHNTYLTVSEHDTIKNGGVVKNGLIGHWPLDINNSGTAPDVSSYANDGTVNGTSLVGNTPTDDSGALAGGATSYSQTGQTEATQYEQFVQSETEHSITRDI